MSASKALGGRRVVVTGAAVGLGAAYAVAAAEAGAAVIVNDLDEANADVTAEAIRAQGGVADVFIGDVSDWEVARSLIAFCVERLGGIDGLVNNAGVFGRVAGVLDAEPGAVERVIRVNVLGSIYPSVHAARAMAAAGRGGAIVNVTSGNQCSAAMVATYGASKGAIASLTYAWSEELGEHDIRVNAISPNAVTPMMAKALEETGGVNIEGERPMPSVEDNAAVVTYLLSDLSSDLTGQVVRVDHEAVSVMSHPVVVSPRASISFGLEAVRAAFDGPLKEALQPSGISVASVEHHGPLY